MTTIASPPYLVLSQYVGSLWWWMSANPQSDFEHTAKSTGNVVALRTSDPAGGRGRRCGRRRRVGSRLARGSSPEAARARDPRAARLAAAAPRDAPGRRTMLGWRVVNYPQRLALQAEASRPDRTSASLFDGHDAEINVMRRLMQAAGAEVIHLGPQPLVARSSRARSRRTPGIAVTSTRVATSSTSSTCSTCCASVAGDQAVRRRRGDDPARRGGRAPRLRISRIYSPTTAARWACGQ